MAEADARGNRTALPIVAVFALLAVVALAITTRHLETPGTYYDEVIQAEPSVQFLAEAGRPSTIPGARSIRLFGGWFPVVIQPYMGALKSQLLIPVFAGFGSSVAVLRVATIAMGLIGLGFAMAFARVTLGDRVAIVAGILLAIDPSFLWTSRHDWGSFAVGLACRGAGLTFLTLGWRRRSALRSFAGGLAFGLGVYNKIDFGVFVAAAGLALFVTSPAVAGAAIRSRISVAVAAAGGFLIGAGPMLAGAGAALAATRNVVTREARGSGDWAEKLHTLRATLDGSYFHELMLAGGSFERMANMADAASSAFGLAFAVCVIALGATLWRDRARSHANPAEAFVWLTTLLLALGLLLTPRAVRIHHALNLYPFPQYVVAICLVRLYAGKPTSTTAGSGRLRRGLAVSILGLVVATSLVVNARISDQMQATGGKGRWSDSIGAFGRELTADPAIVVVSLDWGFDGPLRFATRDLALREPLSLREPIWALRNAHRPGRAWRHSGDANHVYVTFDSDYAVFEFGPALLAAARELGPDDVTISTHLDREGDPAFVSIRFARRHRLTYDGHFEIELE